MYRCNDGFRPSAEFLSTCANTALWDPPPQDHNCTFVEGMTCLVTFMHVFMTHTCTATVDLVLLLRNVSRPDIECPGDVILFRCSVQSNSETVQLSWLVTFPGQETITISYNNESNTNTLEYYPVNITARLTQYTSDQSAESELQLTVLQNVTMSGTILECMSEDLASRNVTVSVNTSGNEYKDELTCHLTLYYSSSYSLWIQYHWRSLHYH